MKNRWAILIGSAIALMVSYSPALQQPFGIYLKPIADSFGWSRTKVSLIYSLTPLVAAPLMLLVGVLVDRIGNRRVILAQAIGLPLLLLAYSMLQPSLLMLALVVCLGGVVNSASTPASINSVLLQWFDRRLGFALGLSMAALGVGTSVLPPLVAHWIGLWGWRGAFRAEAALIAAIGIVNAACLIWDNDAVLRARRVAAQRVDAIDGLKLDEILRRPLFWQLVGCFLLMGLMFAGTSVHFVALMTDRGVSAQTAANFFGLMGLAQIAGRLVCAAVLDRVRVIAFATGIYLLATVAFLLLFLQLPQALYLAPICMGFSAGVEVDVMGLIVRRWFGLRAAGRVFSMCFTAFIVGSAFGPLLMAAAFDRTHSYQLPLGGFVIGSLLVALAFAGISRYPQVAPRPPASVGEIAIGPNPPAELAAAPSAATP